MSGCFACKGKGILIHNVYVSCPSCRGIGHREYVLSETTICFACRGKGNILIARKDICHYCRGLGHLKI